MLQTNRNVRRVLSAPRALDALTPPRCQSLIRWTLIMLIVQTSPFRKYQKYEIDWDSLDSISSSYINFLSINISHFNFFSMKCWKFLIRCEVLNFAQVFQQLMPWTIPSSCAFRTQSLRTDLMELTTRAAHTFGFYVFLCVSIGAAGCYSSLHLAAGCLVAHRSCADLASRCIVQERFEKDERRGSLESLGNVHSSAAVTHFHIGDLVDVIW